MSQLDYIYWKLNEYRQTHIDEAKRVVLGHKTWQRIKDEVINMGITVVNNIAPHIKIKNSIIGLEVSLSKRPNYVRILPAKMKYMRKGNFLRKTKWGIDQQF